jgi:multidrug efflux pump subunit AcrA (membrane-fusion protein)
VVWKAKVKRVDPFPKPASPRCPAQYFATLLEIEGQDRRAAPGQRLHATIVLDEKPKALVVPRQAVFRRDNDNIVYRRSGGRFEPTKVKIGRRARWGGW